MSKTYVVTTGWWCKQSAEKDMREHCFGDEKIRSSDFFYEWYNAVNTFTKPEKILIVDSASPVKPPKINDQRLECISLNENPGHSTNHVGKYCGVTRAHILGMQYALMCDVDYWVYIEQDALIYGENIIEKCISRMSKGIMFGCGRGTPQPTQQSLIIIHKSKIQTFINRLISIKSRDNEISPEMKFAIASSAFFKFFPEILFKENRANNFFGRLIYNFISRTIKLNLSFDIIPFGFGRKRPLDFGQDCFYFQHGESSELFQYRKLMHDRNKKSSN